MTSYHKTFILCLSKYGVVTWKELKCKVFVFSAAAVDSQQDTRTVQRIFQSLPIPPNPLLG